MLNILGLGGSLVRVVVDQADLARHPLKKIRGESDALIERVDPLDPILTLMRIAMAQAIPIFPTPTIDTLTRCG